MLQRYKIIPKTKRKSPKNLFYINNSTYILQNVSDIFGCFMENEYFCSKYSILLIKSNKRSFIEMKKMMSTAAVVHLLWKK